MARSKEHPDKPTLKKVGLEKTWTLYNQRGNWTRSIQTRTSRRMDHTQCFQQRPINTLQNSGICKSIQGTSTTPPDIVNKEKEYEVEEIRGHCKKERGTQFLIHWNMAMNMTNRWQRQIYHMQKRQFKTIGYSFQDKTFKREH